MKKQANTTPPALQPPSSFFHLIRSGISKRSAITSFTPNQELLAIHRRGIALDWPKASYLEAAAWCEANNKLEALSYWRRMAHFAGSPQ